MRALDHKLFRDLWEIRGQVLAIACVLAGGIATYVMSASTHESLVSTQASVYREFRFPEVFAGMRRAPESVVARIAAIPGVAAVEGRVVAGANLELEGYGQPVTSQIVTLPVNFNQLHLHAGRMPEPGRDREALVTDGFAKAHKLKPGFPLTATVNGRRMRLHVVGIVSTPEFIYQIAPGSIVPDFKTYCILWMAREPLEAAFDMKGAVNQVAATLDRGVRPQEVIEAIDRILRPYGGQGAYARKDQVSHRFLSEEFKQLQVMATLFPAIFLAVAAFLLNVVVSRLMTTQRSQIATLKAFGYTTTAVVVHFLKFTMVIVVIGTAMGVGGGLWLGGGLADMYMEFYRFPYMRYELSPRVFVYSFVFSVVAAGTGTIFAVWRAARESPAVAMQPANPGLYRRSLFELPWFSQPTRMIVRNIERRPVKSLLSIAGIAMSTAILILGGFWGDAVDYMVFAQLRRAQIEDVNVTFFNPVSTRALYSLRSLPGVTHAEPTRNVAARFRFEQRTYRTALQGYEPDGHLRRLLDENFRAVEIPEEGILLTDHLAKMLHIRPGQLLTVELLEGSRAVRQVPVAAVVKEYIGVSAYMRRSSLNRLLREGDSATGALLMVDRDARPALYQKLKTIPAVAGSVEREQVLRAFYETMAAQMLTFAFFNTLLAGTIAIGVVYNTVRISLSERSRELASLRVLGYTRGEVAYILLGELTVLVFLAIPLGLFAGFGLAQVMAATAQTELFRVPVVVDPATFALAALVVALAAAGSAFLVGRQVNHLDLVEVLKARE